MEIFKTPKPENKIEENDNIFIPPKEKDPLMKQLIDNLYIECNKSNKKQENKIQNIDKIEILKTPKPQNKIEIKDNILIEALEKEPLLKQFVDDLIIERNPKKENEIQKADKLDILSIHKNITKNIIEKKYN